MNNGSYIRRKGPLLLASTLWILELRWEYIFMSKDRNDITQRNLFTGLGASPVAAAAEPATLRGAGLGISAGPAAQVVRLALRQPLFIAEMASPSHRPRNAGVRIGLVGVCRGMPLEIK
jgi:hypothetical protein